MTPAERSLLLAVFRWARANDWVRLGNGWCSKATSITPTGRGAYIYGETLPMTFTVGGVAASVDVLVALGILPHRFSTSYRAGWDAMQRYSEEALCGHEYIAIRPAAKRELAVRP